MELLKNWLTSNNIEFDVSIIEKLELFRQLLISENKKYNLTAITQNEEIEKKHFIDSLQTYKMISGNVLDIGTGAGFPSIVLALFKKECNFKLIDSTNKKIEFIKLVKRELDIKNIEPVHIRAEDLDKNYLYDCCVARAFAPLNILCEYALPFIKIGKNLFAYKGSTYQKEINDSKRALTILNGKIEAIHQYSIDEQNRCIIEIKKVEKTPSIYPRANNKARLKPL